MQGISGRIALITGGASGIGAGLVEAFARAGAKVIFADIQAEAGAAVAQAVKGTVFQPADLREDRDIDHLVEKAQSACGGIDFLINAAATYADKGFESDRAMWLNGFDTNLIGHVMLAKRAHALLCRSSWPTIIYFTSEAAHVGLTGRWIYPATKAAIEQVTRSQALDLAPDRIRVNAVLPGWTEKPWHKSAPQEVKDHYADMANRLHMMVDLAPWTKSPAQCCFCAPSMRASLPEAASGWMAGIRPSVRKARRGICRRKCARTPVSNTKLT